MNDRDPKILKMADDGHEAIQGARWALEEEHMHLARMCLERAASVWGDLHGIASNEGAQIEVVDVLGELATKIRNALKAVIAGDRAKAIEELSK